MTLKGKLTGEVEIRAPADKFHDVFSARPHHISNITPGKIQSCQVHEGDWGKPGTVICWDYTHEGVAKVAKEIIEEIDDKNLSTTFKVIEGDLMKDYTNFRLIVKATPKGTGSLVHWTLEYEKLHDDINEPVSLLEFVIHTTRDIDGHLIQAQA